VEVAKARAEQAALRYEKAVLTAFREVEDALLAVHKTGERMTHEKEQVTSLETAYKLAEIRYRHGRASYLDALTAQRELFEAELAWSTTRRNHLVAVVHLYKALGGGWSPEEPRSEQVVEG
jgi:outer membrane protein, multidrug efflux system